MNHEEDVLRVKENKIMLNLKATNTDVYGPVDGICYFYFKVNC